MTVMTTAFITVKPGRFEEYQQNAGKVKSILESLGAKNVRLFAGFIAGEATGRLIFASEGDDLAAAGAYINKGLANPELQKMLTLGDDNPMASYQITQWIEVPL